MYSDYLDIGETMPTEEGDNISTRPTRPTRSPGISPSSIRLREMEKKKELRKKWDDIKSNKLPLHDSIFDPINRRL